MDVDMQYRVLVMCAMFVMADGGYTCASTLDQAIGQLCMVNVEVSAITALSSVCGSITGNTYVLASIETESELQAIEGSVLFNSLVNPNYFFGLTSIGVENWQWTSGQILTWTNWQNQGSKTGKIIAYGDSSTGNKRHKWHAASGLDKGVVLCYSTLSSPLQDTTTEVFSTQNEATTNKMTTDAVTTKIGITTKLSNVQTTLSQTTDYELTTMKFYKPSTEDVLSTKESNIQTTVEYLTTKAKEFVTSEGDLKTTESNVQTTVEYLTTRSKEFVTSEGDLKTTESNVQTTVEHLTTKSKEIVTSEGDLKITETNGQTTVEYLTTTKEDELLTTKGDFKTTESNLQTTIQKLTTKENELQTTEGDLKTTESVVLTTKTGSTTKESIIPTTIESDITNKTSDLQTTERVLTTKLYVATTEIDLTTTTPSLDNSAPLVTDDLTTEDDLATIDNTSDKTLSYGAITAAFLQRTNDVSLKTATEGTSEHNSTTEKLSQIEEYTSTMETTQDTPSHVSGKITNGQDVTDIFTSNDIPSHSTNVITNKPEVTNKLTSSSIATTSDDDDGTASADIPDTTIQALTLQYAEFINVPEYVTCGDAPVVQHSVSEYVEIQIDISVNYHCVSGYEFSDGSTKTSTKCDLTSGSWLTVVPDCQVKRCSPVPQVDNAVPHTSTNEINTVVTYDCPVGYKFPDGVTSHSIECLQSKLWSDILPACVAIVCPTLVISTGITTYSSQVNNFCSDDNNYMDDGSLTKTIECSAYETWSGTISHCSNTNCPPPPYVENASLSSQNSQESSILTLTCFEGHRFPDGFKSKTITCKDGQWSDVYTKCLVITCPPVPHVNNSNWDTDLAIYGTQVNYTCNYGFRFPSNTTQQHIMCQGNGTWNQVLDDCEEIQCGTPPIVSNSVSLLPNNASVGQKVLYTCKNEHRFIDGVTVKNMTCTKGGLWHGIVSDCEKGRCPPVPALQNLVPSTIHTAMNTTVTLVPVSGFKFAGQSTEVVIQCGQDLIWHGSVPDIEDVTCPQLQSSDHLLADSSLTDYATIVHLNCSKGYIFPDGSKSVNVTCQSSGQWSLDMSGLQCSAIQCISAPRLGNSTGNSTTGSYDETITYMCRKGYTFPNGQSVLETICLYDGYWSYQGTGCTLVQCPTIPVWQNIAVDTTMTTYRTSIQYVCTDNTTFTDGSNPVFKTAVCDHRGAWLPDIVHCQGSPIAHKLTSPPTEAENANTIGTIAAVVVSIPLVLIILMDIVTSPEQAQYFFKNIYHGILNCKDAIVYVKQCISLHNRTNYVAVSYDLSRKSLLTTTQNLNTNCIKVNNYEKELQKPTELVDESDLSAIDPWSATPRSVQLSMIKEQSCLQNSITTPDLNCDKSLTDSSVKTEVSLTNLDLHET